jgi:alanyl-tRNA synthetase
LLDEKKRLERQVEDLLREGGKGKGERDETHQIGDVELSVGESPVSDRGQIGLLMDVFREKSRSAIQVLFVSDDRPGIHVGVTDDLISRGVKAGDIVSRIAAVSGGKGGGRPHFASAGAGDPARLADARAAARSIVADVLGVEAS